MAALWNLGAVGIYVNRLEREKKGIWAEIDIIDATSTTLHWYGSRSARWRIGGTLWGRSNIDTLEGYLDSSTTRALTGPNSLNVNFKIMGVNARRIPDKTDVTNECFGVDVEMIYDG